MSEVTAITEAALPQFVEGLAGASAIEVRVLGNLGSEFGESVGKLAPVFVGAVAFGDEVFAEFNFEFVVVVLFVCFG